MPPSGGNIKTMLDIPYLGYADANVVFWLDEISRLGLVTCGISI